MGEVDLQTPSGMGSELDELTNLVHEVSDQIKRITPTLRRIEQWETDGTFNHLDNVLHFLNALLDSVTPEIFGSLAQLAARGMETADVAAHSRIAKIAPGVLQRIDDALTEPTAHERHEIAHLLKLLKDPEVQDGLEIVFRLLRGLGAEHAKIYTEPKRSYRDGFDSHTDGMRNHHGDGPESVPGALL